ncbi:hypothetical protein G9A89_012345 [Geosiphon pyriformis]|nr:hypothetical protein G9A89_012345 [Geosiphon pyriformis]
MEKRSKEKNLSVKPPLTLGPMTKTTTSYCQEELTWETNNLTWTDNEQEEASSWEWNEDKRKGKEKEEGMPPTTNSYNSYTHYTSQQFNYQQPRLVCINCGKKLSSMGTCCGDNEEYHTTTKFYCRSCLLECFGQPKRQEKWNNQLCLACGETLLDEEMWNDISGHGGTCNVSCQYMILISNWIRKGTPIEVVWRRAVQ